MCTSLVVVPHAAIATCAVVAWARLILAPVALVTTPILEVVQVLAWDGALSPILLVLLLQIVAVVLR